MTGILHLTLLGKPQVTLNETPVAGFRTAKAQALQNFRQQAHQLLQARAARIATASS